MLEFGVPRGVARPAWELWVRIGLPAAGMLISPGRREVGSFLGPSIRDFHRANDKSFADEKALIGADCPKSRSVTAYAAEWILSSPMAASLLSTAVCRMPPAQKPITLTFSAPVI